jgi:hypothetical protein
MPRSFARCRALLLAILVATLIPGLAAKRAQAAPASFAPSDVYAGWAMEAYPDLAPQDFVTAFTRMRDGGANLVWLGHANPADVNPAANEVGLAYPVYAAALDPSSPQNGAAQAIIAAQRRALDAARAVGLKVVFPINYRTQMGTAWNQQHSDSLRRGPDGAILDFGGVDASPYSAAFQSDTARYYAWVDQNFVGPYRDVIRMINLCDEPTGVDYSSAADATFASRVGYHFADVGNDQQRITQLGAFQSDVMVDFATWAARQWQAIDPSVTVTISFDGGPGRKNQQAPAIEDIFRQAPANFEPAWDAFLRDGTPTQALNDSDVTGLAVLVGTIGHFSAQYQRPFWLWSAGNSWGLGQGSGDPDSIADAQANARLLADVSLQAGGLLRGIAVWNYNLRSQGLYNDSFHTSYQADDLFNRVTAMLPAVRQILAGPSGSGPDVFVLAPNAMPDRMLGGTRLVDIWNFEGYNFEQLVSLVRSGATPAVVGTLAGVDLSRARLVVVLARGPGDLENADVAALRSYRSGGGIVVDAQAVDDALTLGAQWKAPGKSAEYYFGDTYTATQAGPVSSLGLPRLKNSFVFRGPSETLVYGGATNDPPAQVAAWLSLPGPTSVIPYGPSGVTGAATTIGPGLLALPTARHTFDVLPTPLNLPVLATTDHYFPQTGFRVTDPTIWDYFSRRGGISTFGYPVSRPFQLDGFTVQFFQRRIIQLDQNGSPRLLNVLDPGLLPYATFNGATVPAFDSSLVASAPAPADAGANLAFIRANVPDTFDGMPVNFGQTYWATVSPAAALPDGGDPGLIPGFDLEMWGIPTSQPALDPNNHAVVYQRFQRGVMMFDGSCNCTEGMLLADYLKSILIGTALPSDLAREAQSSPFFGQYDANRLDWVHNAKILAGTDLTNAFTPG